MTPVAPMARSPERGASSLVVVALTGLLVTVTVALLGAVVLVHSHRVAAAAADLAALAGAQQQMLGADACAVAAAVAQENGARLTTCVEEGERLRVVVGVPAPGWVGDVTGAVLRGEALAGSSRGHVGSGGGAW